MLSTKLFGSGDIGASKSSSAFRNVDTSAMMVSNDCARSLWSTQKLGGTFFLICAKLDRVILLVFDVYCSDRVRL